MGGGAGLLTPYYSLLTSRPLFRHIDQHTIGVGDKMLAKAAAVKVFLVLLAVAADKFATR